MNKTARVILNPTSGGGRGRKAARSILVGLEHRGIRASIVATGAPFSGRTDESAAGNGSLMRLAPVPLFFAADADLETMVTALNGGFQAGLTYTRVGNIGEGDIAHAADITDRRRTDDALRQDTGERFEVVLTNPPFGGKESAAAQTHFPYRTSATQVLFAVCLGPRPHRLRCVHP